MYENNKQFELNYSLMSHLAFLFVINSRKKYNIMIIKYIILI